MKITGQYVESIKKDSPSYLIAAAEVTAIVGAPLKSVFRDVLFGGKKKHPLKHIDKFRWDPVTDVYRMKPTDDPALLLFRRGGKWRVSFEEPDYDEFHVPLFQDAALNDPVYSLIAIFYAIQVAKYPHLRKAFKTEIRDASRGLRDTI